MVWRVEFRDHSQGGVYSCVPHWATDSQAHLLLNWSASNPLSVDSVHQCASTDIIASSHTTVTPACPFDQQGPSFALLSHHSDSSLSFQQARTLVYNPSNAVFSSHHTNLSPFFLTSGALRCALHLVMFRGNPWVQGGLPLPLPLKTPTLDQG